MLFQRIESEGLSHYSYLLGINHKAIVIDPRRDIDIYLDMAERNEHRITCILETHRNEDYLVGSLELANRTGAYHIHVTELVKRSGEIPQDRPVFIFCGSGLRSMVAASLLRRQGWQNLTVVLGGFVAWTSVRCPVRRAKTRPTAEEGF
jgi:rhodanese-related sulfurtransferase